MNKIYKLKALDDFAVILNKLIQNYENLAKISTRMRDKRRYQAYVDMLREVIDTLALCEMEG